MGYAWDINYFARIGRIFTIQLTNNYGSPEIPGIQMGLIRFAVNTKFYTGNRKKYFSAQYINSSRNYNEFSYAGLKLPGIYLHDQYANILYNSHDNSANTWSAGPSMELYNSRRPSHTIEGEYIEYRTQKLRFEYKAVIARRLLLSLKTGLADIYYKATEEIRKGISVLEAAIKALKKVENEDMTSSEIGSHNKIHSALAKADQSSGNCKLFMPRYNDSTKEIIS